MNQFDASIFGVVHRKGINELMQWLANTDFYTAPASTQYHGACEGGLVQHSLNVYKRLKEINTYYNFGFNEESMAIVALFHDLCKVDFYKISTRNVKNETTGQWEKVPFYKRDEQFHFGGHGSKSLFLVMNFMQLTPDEASAINCHMGPWDKSDYSNPGDVFNTNPLAWALHVADEAATYLDKT